MIKFNDNTIETGYIKELLRSFNLPNMPVYVENDKHFNEQLYVKENSIVKCYIDDQGKETLVPVYPYSFNKKITNLTKNLITNTLNYDYHTHEYLGEYLRFLRDYSNLNLMSLYNCFSNRIPSNLNLEKTIIERSSDHPDFIAYGKSYSWKNTSLVERTGIYLIDNTQRIYLKIDVSLSSLILEQGVTGVKDTTKGIYSLIGFNADDNTVSLYVANGEDSMYYSNFKGSFDYKLLGLDTEETDDGVLNDFFSIMRANSTFLYTSNINFSSYDSQTYKLYIVPVKLNKNYTIALSSDVPYEVMCILYDKGYFSKNINGSQSITTENQLATYTYKYITSSSFKTPILYDLLTQNLDKLNYKEIYENEDSLKLLIKLPINCESSIVILEGDYTESNKKHFDLSSSNYISFPKSSKIVINYKEDYHEADAKYIDVPVESGGTRRIYDTKQTTRLQFNDLNLKSNIQLLNINSKISHPFSNRLLEYLTDNAITHLDNISDNIKRLQKTLVTRAKNKKGGIESYGNSYGIWEDRYKYVIFDIARRENLLDDKDDILGYVDKDVENKLGKPENIYTEIYDDIHEVDTY